MSRMIKSKIVIAGLVTLLCVACKPTTPSQYIQPDDMEDLLVDFHKARALAVEEGGSYNDINYRKVLYWRAALQKHQVTEEQFDSSLVYYYGRADRFADMYKHVLSRLEEEALQLGATEGDIGRYATLSETGDTANIWTTPSTCMLMPCPPYHRLEFSIEGDSLYRPGDTFLVQFVSDFVYQSGSKDGLLYVAVDYPDTVIVKQTRFSYSGLNQLDISSRVKSCPQRVRGFFYLGGANEQTTILRLLFVNSIQIIRFHKKDELPKPDPTDSIASTTAAKRSVISTNGSGNTEGESNQVLSVSRGASPNRMVERIDSLKARH
jgi:hypothetical protein